MVESDVVRFFLLEEGLLCKFWCFDEWLAFFNCGKSFITAWYSLEWVVEEVIESLFDLSEFLGDTKFSLFSCFCKEPFTSFLENESFFSNIFSLGCFILMLCLGDEEGDDESGDGIVEGRDNGSECCVGALLILRNADGDAGVSAE